MRNKDFIEGKMVEFSRRFPEDAGAASQLPWIVTPASLVELKEFFKTAIKESNDLAWADAIAAVRDSSCPNSNFDAQELLDIRLKH
jgi:hypothetical protein